MADSAIPLWLDCDPGHDDAFAILLAAHHPRLNLLGISTVYGNAPLARTTANAGSVLTAIGKPHIPVYAGASNPFCRPAEFAPDIHGASGLDGTDLLPTPLVPARSENAIVAVRDALLATARGTAWIVATGALTNVALLFATFPEVAPWIKGLSIMGGAVGGGFTDAPLGKVDGQPRFGNWTQWAEFNIYCDPESAASIFSNPALTPKTTLIPLDLTHLVLATPTVLSGLLSKSARPPTKSLNPAVAGLRHMLHDLLTFFAETYASVFDLHAGPPLHDPLAVAAILPGSEGLDFNDQGGQRFVIDVVTGVGEQAGRILLTKAEGGMGVRIPSSVDVEKFWALVEACVERAGAMLAGVRQ